MTPRAYYNEIDAYAAQWLRNLIAAGLIAPGDVDERDIRDVGPDELRGYTQCHFFAGIGVWSLALRNAGWPDDRPVWTGSCPCQPFSAAGRRGGTADERHLWPHWNHLIAECGPPAIFGEQVASKDGLGWFDLVSADLEGSAYAVGASDLCAAGVGAPHIRQRLWFCAYDLRPAASGLAHSYGQHVRRGFGAGVGEEAAPETKAREWQRGGANRRLGSPYGGLADADGRHTGAEREQPGGQHGQQPQDGRVVGLADASADRPQRRLRGRQDQEREAVNRQAGCDSATDRSRTAHGGWDVADWLFCRDGKWRPVESGTFPLAHGATSRVGRLRAYGNAIVPQVAAAFIEAAEEARIDAERVRLSGVFG
jgi:DNA (cytosine-5)-methyltransferase 1